MKHLSTTMMILTGAVVFIIGLDGALSGLGKLGANPILGWLPDMFVPATDGARRAYWLAFLLLPVAQVASLLASIQRSRSITLKKTDSETLSLYHSAIVQFVSYALAEVPAILHHKVKVKQVGREGIALTLTLKLQPVGDIRNIQAQIEDKIRRRMKEILGSEKLRNINVIVKDFGGLDVAEPMPTREYAIQARSDTEQAAPPPVESSKEISNPSGDDSPARESDFTIAEPGGDASDASDETEHKEIRLAPPGGVPPEPIEVIHTDDDDDEAGPTSRS